ncbi:MAG: nucleotidyltransferase family protein, partial [Kiloniellales bacterium]
NKLLAEVDGKPMVAHAVEQALASRAEPVVVVTGHERARVEAALASFEVRRVHNPDYAAGLSTSLHRGLAAVPAAAEGVVVCLGDMPRVEAAAIDRLIAAFDPLEGRAICVPTWGGKRGNPVLFARRFVAEMQEIAGDVGARHLIGEYPELVCEVAMDETGAGQGVLVDVDTPEALAALKHAG